MFGLLTLLGFNTVVSPAAALAGLGVGGAATGALGHCRPPQAGSSGRWCTVLDAVATGRVDRRTPAASHRRCWGECQARPPCQAANYAVLNGTCELLGFALGDITERRGWLLSYSQNNTIECGQSVPSTPQNQELPVGWPVGTYGLPMPVAGCPATGATFAWHTGSRSHDTENSGSNNDWSPGIHLMGPYARNDMTQHFCVKTVAASGTSDRSWPPGEYCVFRFENCPEGLSFGSIHWYDQRPGTNTKQGTLPSGAYDSACETRINYCCMTAGDASQPIELPTGEGPFYLLPAESGGSGDPGCQAVRGMRASLEWFKWDNEDSQQPKSPTGSHPHYVEEGSYNNFKIYYCYYQEL